MAHGQGSVSDSGNLNIGSPHFLGHHHGDGGLRIESFFEKEKYMKVYLSILEATVLMLVMAAGAIGIATSTRPNWAATAFFVAGVIFGAIWLAAFIKRVTSSRS